MIEVVSAYHMEVLELEIRENLDETKLINIYNPWNDESISLDKIAAIKMIEALNILIKEIND